MNWKFFVFCGLVGVVLSAAGVDALAKPVRFTVLALALDFACLWVSR